MVFRVFVEKKEGLDNEARALLGDARSLLGIESLEQVRLYNRYDVEGLSADLFDYAKNTVFLGNLWYGWIVLRDSIKLGLNNFYIIARVAHP